MNTRIGVMIIVRVIIMIMMMNFSYFMSVKQMFL